MSATSAGSTLLSDPAPSGPRESRHIAYLDGLRALAVIAVFVRHAWGLSGSPHIPVLGHDLRPLMVMLGAGVDLFFVLSGYLLAQSFFRRRQMGKPPPRYRDYWRARILRIGPPYWVILILVVLFMTPSFIPAERVFSAEGAAIFAAHLGILQTTFISSFGAYSVETPFWTLTIEIIFYALLPLIVMGFYRRRWMITVPVMAALAVTWLYSVRNHADWLVGFVNGPLNVFPAFPEPAVRFFLSHQFPAFLLDFALGILAALIVVSKSHSLKDNALFQRLTSPIAGLVAFVVGSLVVLGSMWVLGTLSIRNGYADPLQYMGNARRADLVYYYFETIPFGIGFSLMLVGLCLAPTKLRSVFSIRPLAYIGLTGYSIYLIHMPVLYVFNRYPWLESEFDPSTHFFKLFFGAGAAVLFLSFIFFHTVEKRAMEWSRRSRSLVPLERPSIEPHEAPGAAQAIDAESAAEEARVADTELALDPVAPEKESLNSGGLASRQ